MQSLGLRGHGLWFLGFGFRVQGLRFGLGVWCSGLQAL